MSNRDAETGESARRTMTWLDWLLIVTVAAALVGAVFVVVRSARRVRLEPPPVSLRQTPRDSLLLSSCRGMQRRIQQTERRIGRHRQQAGNLTPAQDALARQSDSAVAAVRRHLARFDSLDGYELRRALMDSIKREYDSLRLIVKLLGRAVGSPEDSVDVDSLDAEVKRLVSE